MPEKLSGGSVFKFYHISPLGHTFITHDRPAKGGKIRRDEISQKSEFLLRVK